METITEIVLKRADQQMTNGLFMSSVNLIEKVKEELGEVILANESNVDKELGDLILVSILLARSYDIDILGSLLESSDRLQLRLDYVISKNSDFKLLSSLQKSEMWKEAKQVEKRMNS